MDEIKEHKAINIVNNSIDIVLASLRQIVKEQMDESGNVNGFVLLYNINTYSKELKLKVGSKDENGKPSRA